MGLPLLALATVVLARSAVVPNRGASNVIAIVALVLARPASFC
jgi:hypothetical protein